MKTRKLTAMLLAAATAATLLTGCGGSTSTSTANSTAAASTATAEGGRTLKVGTMTAPQNISPFTTFTNRQPVVQYLYETLAYHDAATAEMKPLLAKSWTTEDNITYDFEIYDNIFDTEGNQIKASDVVFCLEHARDEGANTWIATAEATGDYTFTLTLTNDQTSSFATAIERAPIVSQKAYEASADGMATSCVSTAPYVVSQFTPNVSITFTKNQNYWQTDESAQNPLYKNMTVDTLAYTKIAEAAQQTIALETGTIDVYENIANTETANFLEGGRDVDNFDALGYASSTSYVFYFANQGIAGEDIDFRKAVTEAINKDDIVAGAFNGLADVPSFMGAPDNMSDLTPTTAGDSSTYFAFDADAAKADLAKSSYNGETIRLLVPNEDNHNRIAAIVQGQLINAGINCEIASYDNAMFQSSFGDGSAWDIAICQMGMADVAFVWSFLSWDLAGGDGAAMGMAVKDEGLKEVLAPVLTVDGHNTENATKASDYINENVLGENLVTTRDYYIVSKASGIKDIPAVFFSNPRCLATAEFN